MKYPIVLSAILSLSLTGCDRASREPELEPDPSETALEGPEAEPTASIFSPEAELPVAVELEPLTQAVTFLEGGSDLHPEAMAAIETILDSPQIAQGQPIIIGGHSDAGGNDAANLRASLKRAEAVRDVLVSKGVAATRIKLIAFGEQNPVAPNALPDGSPDEAGRAQNRRAEVTVKVKAGAPASETTPDIGIAAD